MKAILVIRDVGSISPDYSLDFELPAIPNPGDYISIFRPDAKSHSEDVIVKKVWWSLQHPETAPVVRSGAEKTGSLKEVIIECEQAIGPYSRDKWRSQLESARTQGVTVEEFEIERFSLKESQLPD